MNPVTLMLWLFGTGTGNLVAFILLVAYLYYRWH